MKLIAVCVLLLLHGSLVAQAALGPPDPFKETVDGITRRLKKTYTLEQLQHLDLGQLDEFLTDPEREVLSAGYISFTVNVPVRLSVVRDRNLDLEPFWLRERGFRTNGILVKVGRQVFDVWDNDFPAGPIGLGANSISGGSRHYFVLLQPLTALVPLQVGAIQPSGLRLDRFIPGVQPYLDRGETVDSVPPELAGRTLICTPAKWVNRAKLLHLFRATDHPSSRRPDEIALTWSQDPRTTQTIQWRTGPRAQRGYVAFEKKSVFARTGDLDRHRVSARTMRLVDYNLLNDPIVYRHTVELTGLEPGTTYVYSVGTGRATDWTEPLEFTTAPQENVPFTFVYLGDAQNGLDQWGALLRRCARAHPEAAFYLLAGDLVNTGSARDEWDSFFMNGQKVFSRRPIMPALGNHDYHGGPGLYLDQFELPRNGPLFVQAERAYSFRYGNAFFVVLDSNLSPIRQTGWLENQLAGSSADWKFVIYHHPAYASASARDNQDIREAWTPLFDRYQVDMALQGHDHAYLRTYPLRAQQTVSDPAAGTTYVVSYSGTKAYAQEPHPYMQVGFTNVPTYQVLEIDQRRLTYSAYDASGQVRDRLIISKPPGTPQEPLVGR